MDSVALNHNFAAAREPAPRAPAAQIDASCRWPVTFLFYCAAFWLVVATSLALVASIKLHAPGFLAHCPWLTFGRVQPAAWNTLVYGFGIQMGLGAALWMTCRIGGVPLMGGKTILIGTLFWNLGLKLALFGILAGHSTGVEGLELPRYAWPLMLGSYLAMAVWLGVTFHFRRERTVFVSQWFVLAAAFGFPWLFAAGNLVTGAGRLRGVLQVAAAAWYVQSLYVVWFTCLGLAVLFYFLPKLSGAPLPSRSLAAFAFWTLLVTGGFAGLQRYWGGPFPAWMLSVSVVAAVLAILPILAVSLNLSPLLHAHWRVVRWTPALWFIAFAFVAFLVSGILSAASAFGVIRQTVHFTLFTAGLEHLFLQGFAGMALLGALDLVAQRLLERPWPFPGLVRAQFFALAGGQLLIFIAYAIGGLVQGNALGDASVQFFTVARRYVPFAGMGTLANLVLLLGALAVLVNLVGIVVARCRESCLPAARQLFEIEASKPAEVRA